MDEQIKILVKRIKNGDKDAFAEFYSGSSTHFLSKNVQQTIYTRLLYGLFSIEFCCNE